VGQRDVEARGGRPGRSRARPALFSAHPGPPPRDLLPSGRGAGDDGAQGRVQRPGSPRRPRDEAGVEDADQALRHPDRDGARSGIDSSRSVRKDGRAGVLGGPRGRRDRSRGPSAGRRGARRKHGQGGARTERGLAHLAAHSPWARVGAPGIAAGDTVPLDGERKTRMTRHGEGGITARDQYTVVDARDRNRFEIRKGEKVAGFTEYRRNGELIAFTHTEVAPDYEGKGLASRLNAAVLDQARKEGLEVLPFCPFVRSYIAKHPGKYLDLV